MYAPLEEGEEVATTRIKLPGTTGVALAVALAFTVAFGIIPAPVIHFATQASRRLLF
jgi:NADH:ubiquinone oxidoreductase subunit 2 (subunit N)